MLIDNAGHDDGAAADGDNDDLKKKSEGGALDILEHCAAVETKMVGVSAERLAIDEGRWGVSHTQDGLHRTSVEVHSHSGHQTPMV